MVHALEQIHRLLAPAGTLIEIHPSVDAPPFVEVRSKGRPYFSENDPVFDCEEDLRCAEEAMASVLDRGVFVLEGRRGFELRTHARSVEELRDYWAVADAYDPRRRRRRSSADGTRCTRERRRSSSAHLGRSSSTWSRPPSRG